MQIVHCVKVIALCTVQHVIVSSVSVLVAHGAGCVRCARCAGCAAQHWRRLTFQAAALTPRAICTPTSPIIFVSIGIVFVSIIFVTFPIIFDDADADKDNANAD